MKLYKATYESRNFSFSCLDQTKEQALAGLHEGLDIHANQYGLAADWWRRFENDLNVVEMLVGVCYRDYSPIQEVDHA